MRTVQVIKRGALILVALGVLAELASVAYSHYTLERTLAPGTRVTLAGSDRRLVYRSRNFTAGWLDGQGEGEVLLPTTAEQLPVAIPITLTTHQGIGLDGSVLRIAAKLKLPPKAQKIADGLNAPVPVTVGIRIFPWRTWDMRAEVPRAWGNVGLMEVNFAGATLHMERRWSSVRSNYSVGHFEIYRGDRSSEGFALDSLQVVGEASVAKGMEHATMTLTAHGLKISRYSIPSISMQGTADTVRPFDPSDNALLTPPSQSGEAIHISKVEVRTASQGLLKANADFTVPPFDEGNIADLIEALRKGFKLRTSISFDHAFSEYFGNVGAKLDGPLGRGPMPRFLQKDDSGHYVCNVSYEAGRTVINGTVVNLPDRTMIPFALIPHALIPQPILPAPMRPVYTVPPTPSLQSGLRVAPQPTSVPPGLRQHRLDWLPFRLGESFPQVQTGLSEIGKHLQFPQGKLTSIHLIQEGIWLFFAPNGSVRTIRLDAPFGGRIHGIGIGDSEAKLVSILGSPVKPPWSFGGNTAYLYTIPEGSVRYDIGTGVVRTIFELSAPEVR